MLIQWNALLTTFRNSSNSQKKQEQNACNPLGKPGLHRIFKTFKAVVSAPSCFAHILFGASALLSWKHPSESVLILKTTVCPL